MRRITTAQGALAALGATLLMVVPAHQAFASTVAPPSQSSARGFVQLEIPKHTAYVGESIPVTVRAYYRADTSVTVTGSPTLRESTFSLRSGDAQQGHAVIGGVRYLVVSWKDHLSPAKAGKYSMGVDVPSTLEWQELMPTTARPSARSGGMDPFASDLFGDSFIGGDAFRQMQQQMEQMMNEAMSPPAFGPVQHKELVLHSPDTLLDVRSLPVVGRPPGFSDAIGHFTLTATAEPLHVKVGEPISLKLRVAGDGNFDRVTLPGIVDSADWKTYGATATDGKGEKTFVEPVIPRSPSVHEIPPVSFAYFDPDARKYVSVVTPPISIEVAPGTAAVAASDGSIPAAPAGPTLAPNASNIGRSVAELTPVYTSRSFWEWMGVPLVLGASAAFVGLTRRRLTSDPRRPLRRAARRAVRVYRAAMEQAVAAGDAMGFFAAARGAIQETLGPIWHLTPAAISLSEIEARLEPTEVDRLRPVFDADAARFSGALARREDLAPWKQVVERELEHLSMLEAA